MTEVSTPSQVGFVARLGKREIGLIAALFCVAALILGFGLLGALLLTLATAAATGVLGRDLGGLGGEPFAETGEGHGIHLVGQVAVDVGCGVFVRDLLVDSVKKPFVDHALRV